MLVTHSIKVATWNIRGGRNQSNVYFDLTTSKNFLNAGNYDLVGLQEVLVNYSSSVSKWPMSALGDGVFYAQRFFHAKTLAPSEPNAEFGNGLLSKDVGILNSTQFDLPNSGFENRVISQSEVLINGKRIIVLVTHLSYEDDALRETQLQFVKSKLDSLNGESFICFGDFNVKNTDEFNIFSTEYQVVNGYNGTYFDTYAFDDWSTKRIDNIICSTDFTIQSPGMSSTTLSDHNLLYTNLSWTEEVADPEPLPVPPPDLLVNRIEEKQTKSRGKLIHILDKKTDEIIGTLNSAKKEYKDAIRHDSLNGENTFNFTSLLKTEKAGLLEKRNRLLIQDKDGKFREYIIVYTNKFSRIEKDVRSNASFVDIAKTKVIDPQTLTGTTAPLAADFALSGSEWQPGEIEFTGTQTLVIEKRTNPLELIKTIAETFALELSFRVEVEGNRVVARYVDMKSQIDGFDGKEIRFGKDLEGLERYEDSNNIITALLGVYEKSDGTELTVWVEDDEALQRWGRVSVDENGNQSVHHLVDWYQPDVYDEEMTLEKLTDLTQKELKKRIDAIVTYEGNAVSIEHLYGREHEKIRVGQTDRLKDEGYNPPLYLEARIQEVDVDQITDRILGFKIFNFIEFSKADLEKQIAGLKQQLILKAARVVLGPDGEVVTNLDESGFSEINASNINSPSVPNFNAADINFYVDPVNGDNNRDGFSWETAKLTIQACIETIPKVNNGKITISCKAPTASTRQDYIGNVILEGFTGSGSITIEGVNWYNYINGRISISGCTNSIEINNFTVNLTEVTKVAVEILSSNNVSLDKIWVYGQTTIAAFSVSKGSRATISNSEGYDCTYIILCNDTSTAYVNTCKGYGNIRGIVAQDGGWITVNGTYPGGATSNAYNDNGGSISFNGATVNNGSKGTVPTQLYTEQWASNVADNWSTSYSSWQGGGAKQGNWGYGQRKGFWWFESNPIDLNGKTIKSMRVWIKRATGGNSGKTRIYLHPHTYGTKGATPSNPSLALETSYNVYVDLSWGDPGTWINIPSSWFAGFQNGTYKGIGIWAGSNSKEYYAVMDGQCWVEATYQ